MSILDALFLPNHDLFFYQLVQQYAAGANVTVTFPSGGRPVDYADPNGGLVSDFSTYCSFDI